MNNEEFSLPLMKLFFIFYNHYQSMESILGVTPHYLKNFRNLFSRELAVLEKRFVSLKKNDILVLIFLRIRIHLSFRAITPLAGVSRTTCWRVITSGIRLLGKTAESLIRPPSLINRLKRERS